MNFGFADFGFAAGALPPPPELSVVLVVSVDVDEVSVELESVLELLLVESAVVDVIVVTTVLPPVVTVVTIVVVACAAKGAAPAVNAAVAAPSVISTAKAAPHAAYFLYCLLIPPPSFLDFRKRLPRLSNTYSIPRKPGSGDPSCSAGSKYIRDQATRPLRTPKMNTPRSFNTAPLREVPWACHSLQIVSPSWIVAGSRP
ncbi:MAG: hypothetical protein H0W90_06645 [Actinobacteria bacterium]|nr:hypothetical protein [Actinomycetota bacterium]